MIEYKTLYWIVTTVLFIYYMFNNSFDKELGWIREKSWTGSYFISTSVMYYLHKLVGGTEVKIVDTEHINDQRIYTTFASRFRVRVLLYLMSWVLWFILF